MGLIITGGMAPNREAGVFSGASGLYAAQDVADHRQVTGAVHAASALIAMQILHAGHYAYGVVCVSASALRAPIARITPLALDETGIAAQIADMGTAAARAWEPGYDGVEIIPTALSADLCPST